MFIELRRDDARPLYRQIADEVRRAVSVGILKPGEGLPAARELAAQLKVNSNTVQHAYRTLAHEGIVETRRGLGMFIAASPRRDARQSPSVIARQIAEQALREAFRHGLLASDLRKALDDISPKSS
jgi:GntR family transcriptional regulator